ncbi:MAG: Uncharacterized protein CEN87_189 [Parcubacteria group bacterium Licking1014_1]|nr:MAG: Uncharacterized protein CEN87_189 [Parcubacteria group bacterium Licking1014_1]
MSIRKTIITTIVSLAVVAMVAPGVAQGVTIEELLAQITQLQAQLVALQQAQGQTAGVPAVCSGVTFTRNLRTGSTGSDVKCLQAVLNLSATTQVAATGAGSPGNETTTFGPKTLVAVKKYQTANGILPANQVGPMTRAKLNVALGGVVVTPGQPPVVVPTGAGLSVQLAYDNPAAGTVVDTQGLAPLAKFTFVNGDNAEVKVTGLKLKRIGISADATLVNVYLFEGAKRLTDSASVASTIINFNDSTGVFTVPAGSSKTISVLADVDGATGETVGIQLVASTDVTSNASSVKGTFPATGNYFTLADGTNLATFYFSDETGTVTPSAASIDPQNDYAIWYDNAIVGTRAVNLSRVAFRVGGSVNRTTDIQNFRLLIDGVQQGAAIAQADANDYVTFDLSASPVKLETGTRVVKVLADIIGGSNKNVYLSLRTAADVSVVDSQLNANLKIKRYNTTTNFTAEDSGTQSINAGTLTVTKMTTSPSGDVVNTANNASLAKFELKAAGEKVKVESLRVSATVSTSTVGKLRNGAVYANGVQIGSTADLWDDGASTTYTTYNFGSSLIVEPGSPVTLEVRADIYDNDGTNHIVAGTTIRANIEGGDLNNAYGMVSMTTVDVPSADVNANTVTVRAGSLVLSNYSAYTNQRAVAPLNNYKLGHFTLTAATTEAVNINTITVTLNYVSGTSNNLYVKFGNNTTSVKTTVAASNAWAVNYSVEAGKTVDAIVYANITSSALGTAIASMYVNGTTASSATAVCADTNATCVVASESALAGQSIVFTTGTPTLAVDGSTPEHQAVAGNQSVVAGKFKLTAQNDDYTIKELRFTILGTDATSAVANSLTLKDGSAALATVPYDGTNDYYNITGLSVLVAANTSKVLTAELNLVTPYTNGSGSTAPTLVTTGKDAKITLSYAKVANSQGTESEPTASKVANYTYVYKTVPTFSLGSVSGQGGLLSSGSTVKLYEFSIAANAKGPVALKQLKFAVDVTDNGGAASSPTLDTFAFFRGSTDISSTSNNLVEIYEGSATSLESTTSNLDENDATAVYVVFRTEEVIEAGTTKTYSLKARAQGFGSTSSDPDSVSTTLSADTTPSGVSAGANATHYFLDADSTTDIQALYSSAAGEDFLVTSGAIPNVIWSDNSAQLHDYTYNSTSSDWFNGYLLGGLPLSSIGVNYAN